MMKLGFADRMNLTTLLPEKGNINDQLICRQILDKIAITETEKTKSGLQIKSTVDGKNSFWDWDKKHEKEIEIIFNASEINLLKDQINKLDKEGLITLQVLSLCVRIKELAVPPKSVDSLPIKQTAVNNLKKRKR